MTFQVKAQKRVKLTSSHLLFQVKIHVTNLQLVCPSILFSFVYFIVYAEHEGVSDILMQERKLSVATVNPYKRLHGGICLSVSPGP